MVDTTNGVSLNGVSLNGVSLNGVSLNGVSLNGVSLNGVSLNGVSLNGVTLNGSELVGVRNKKNVRGSAFVGALLDGTLSDGSTVKLRIDGYRAVAGVFTTLSYYTVSYSSSGSWVPLCGTSSSGVAIEAIALKGTWDLSQGTPTGGGWTDSASTITFGCRSAALGKCVDLGYDPWYTYLGRSLRPFHQTCTRVLRADYCGDGSSYTVNGTLINLYDVLGIQQDTETWTFEAQWDDRGAICASGTRIQSLPSLPPCFAAIYSSTCGASIAPNALLMDEYVPPPPSGSGPTE
jgi:hypothetical protein